MRMFAALALLVVAAPVTAQSEAPIVDVRLTNFDFTPGNIELVRGRSYALRLTNTSGGGHSFGAKSFFAAASIAPADRPFVRNGIVEVPKGQSRIIHFIAPMRGTYSLKCTHTLHKAFGMSGTIIVR